jgi:hypothetical protein
MDDAVIVALWRSPASSCLVKCIPEEYKKIKDQKKIKKDE